MSATGTGMMLAGMALSYAGSQAAAEAQEVAGRWNKQVAERNASLLRTAAEDLLLESKLDILNFQTQYRKFEKETESAIMKSGFDAYSGTGLEILLANADQADEEIRRIDYASRARARDIREQATGVSLKGDIAMFEAKASANATRTEAMATLLSQGGKMIPA